MTHFSEKPSFHLTFTIIIIREAKLFFICELTIMFLRCLVFTHLTFIIPIIQGAKLFYLSGMVNGEYQKTEVHNLCRFISVMKFRPLQWRITHPYVVVDRYKFLFHQYVCLPIYTCDASLSVGLTVLIVYVVTIMIKVKDALYSKCFNFAGYPYFTKFYFNGYQGALKLWDK